MDSKRDHRGGHRNIYDQIDLEIINSKGPGPEKSINPKYRDKKIIFRGINSGADFLMVFKVYFIRHI